MKNSIAIASLLIAAATLLPSPALAAASYTWNLTCAGNAYGNWSWLQDGAVITNQTFAPNCNTSGTGTVPSNANGVTASITALVGFTVCRVAPCPCPLRGNSASVTKSFDPAKGVSVNLHVSATEQCGGTIGRLTSSADLSLQS